MFISSKQWAETDTTKALKAHQKQSQTPRSIIRSIKKHLQRLKTPKKPPSKMAGRGGYN
jgi:hypothetical protein